MTSPIRTPHHAPVTPPPENMAYPKMPSFSEHEEPFSMKAFQDPAFQNAQLKFQQAQMHTQRRQQEHQHQPSRPQPPPTASSHGPAHPSATPSSQPLPPSLEPQISPRPPNYVPPATGAGRAPTTSSSNAGAAASLDPKYLAMVSRIAAYYQQRCQAVANYQQQRCQAWATMHRQKCQEMVQAAMLVVAWYIRDRIQRRRQRQKRKFRRGLCERTSRPKVSKGEVVRRWVLQVPESAPSPNEAHQQRLVDREEAEFSMDRDAPPDRDTKLFSVADNLIKSQLSKIEVPLMGALSFDESESESESEAMNADIIEEGGEDDEDDDDDDMDDNDDDDDDEGDQDGDEDAGLWRRASNGNEFNCKQGGGANHGCSNNDLCTGKDNDYMCLDDYEDYKLGSDLVQDGTGEGSHLEEHSSML